MKAIRQIIRGCTNLPYVGEHPGKFMMVLFMFMGGMAGGGKGGTAHLCKVPAKVRFLSIEPLLEDLGELNLERIGWVIVGGESGVGFRPMCIEWVRKIAYQCAVAGVPFFYKQSGGLDGGDSLLDGVEVKQWPMLS